MPKKTIVTTSKKETTSKTKALETINASKFKGKILSESVIGQLLVDLQHNTRRATAHTKTRGEVRGSTRKPWRQKGTGRARVGTRRTPVWRGGGRVFGPTKERNFIRKINKKLINPALLTVLQKKAEKGNVYSMPEIAKVSKTNEAIKIFKGSLDAKSNLIVIPEKNEDLKRNVNNVSYITLRQISRLNLLDVAKHRKVIFTGDTLDQLIKKLS
ncbi:MAG: 50S ribosomal protein L4 [Patescibacteria group bacterium]|nr:50S ribosomal protein L4 [Patescibacteria group bacterium]